MSFVCEKRTGVGHCLIATSYERQVLLHICMSATYIHPELSAIENTRLDCTFPARTSSSEADCVS